METLQALKKIGITFIEPTNKAEWQAAADLSVQKLMDPEIRGVVNTYLELLKNFRSIENTNHFQSKLKIIIW